MIFLAKIINLEYLKMKKLKKNFNFTNINRNRRYCLNLPRLSEIRTITCKVCSYSKILIYRNR